MKVAVACSESSGLSWTLRKRVKESRTRSGEATSYIYWSSARKIPLSSDPGDLRLSDLGLSLTPGFQAALGRRKEPGLKIHPDPNVTFTTKRESSSWLEFRGSCFLNCFGQKKHDYSCIRRRRNYQTLIQSVSCSPLDNSELLMIQQKNAFKRTYFMAAGWMKGGIPFM